MRQTIKIGITVLVVATLAMSGIALAAQTATDDTPAVEDTKAYGGIQAKLAPLVEDGTITQAQADAIATTLAEGMQGRGPGGRRGFAAIKQVAEFLELDAEEMKAAIAEYDTIAEIAEANGSSGEAVVDHLVAQLTEKLDEAVANGRLTQEEADEKLANASEHFTELVNSDIPEPGSRRGGGGPGGEGKPPLSGGSDA